MGNQSAVGVPRAGDFASFKCPSSPGRSPVAFRHPLASSPTALIHGIRSTAAFYCVAGNAVFNSAAKSLPGRNYPTAGNRLHVRRRMFLIGHDRPQIAGQQISAKRTLDPKRPEHFAPSVWKLQIPLDRLEARLIAQRIHEWVDLQPAKLGDAQPPGRLKRVERLRSIPPIRVYRRAMVRPTITRHPPRSPPQAPATE